jgi:hypothetical protein
VNSFEVGYKGLWLRQRLVVDADFYYNVYRNFIAQVEANIPKGNPSADSVAYYLADRTKQDRYRLWTNSKTVVHNYGASLGLRYAVAGSWVLTGNGSLAQLNRTESGDGFEEAFNTPKWIANAGVSNVNVYRGIGFAINFKYQGQFMWQSSLATGIVPAIRTTDAQASYALKNSGLLFKIGATNLFNQQYYTFVAGPSVGGFYYTSIVWSGLN